MPLHGFICRACGAQFDERRPFARSDDPAVCPTCGSMETRQALAMPLSFSRSTGDALMLAALTTAAKPLPDYLRHGDGCPCARCRALPRGDTPPRLTEE